MRKLFLNTICLIAVTGLLATACADWTDTCTVTDNGDGTSTITCPDGSSATFGESQDQSCSVNDNGDGSHTISCPDGTEITLGGGGGEACTVADNGDGTSTISCPDGSTATVLNTDLSLPREAQFNFSGQLEDYQVPMGTHQLRLVVEGASGGPLVVNSVEGGLGARVEALVDVTPGEVLSILVGEQPEKGNYCSAAGGGGSFVVDAENTPLAVAGAGAGAMELFGGADGRDASLTSEGDSSGDLQGGVGGSGGFGSPFLSGSGGGGGLLGDGQDASDGQDIGAGGGRAFVNGGAGGQADPQDSCPSASGGFGGGGAGGADSMSGGGGGGYSGGAGSSAAPSEPAGGGGSYSSDENAIIELRERHGHGRVIITPL